MGGKSSAQKKQEATNNTMAAQNAQRAYDYERQAASNEAAMSSAFAKMDLESRRMKAGYEASQKVTEERANAIRMSGSLLTDFERQEKIRLREAKKGVGQVGDEDFLISESDRQNALSLLEKPASYWDAKRQKAFDKASAGVSGSCHSCHGGGCSTCGGTGTAQGAASVKFAETQQKAQEAGAAYSAEGGKTVGGTAGGTSRQRNSLLGSSSEDYNAWQRRMNMGY